MSLSAGTNKFFGRQELGVSSGLDDKLTKHGSSVSSQPFNPLYQNQPLQNKNRSGSFGFSTGIGPSSTFAGRYSHDYHRDGLDAVGADDRMGKAWIRWMHKRGIKVWVLPLLVLISALLKFCIGLGTYSGISFASSSY